MSETLPQKMTQVAIKGGGGGPDVLVPELVDLPKPGDGEVLIKLHAAGVNRPDVLQRQGNYPPPPGATDIPGLEVAGEIVALGQNTKEFGLGNEVCALTISGGYAEYCAVPEAQVLPKPGPLSLIEAAGLPETFFTVWTNVFESGRLRSGETLLVHGGSSGIGTTAIQLAKHFGSRVLTTVGNAEKAKACLELGADVAINYRDDDFVSAAKKENGGKGVDVILDMVGGDYVERNLKALAPKGRLVQIAWLKSPRITANFAPLMLKRLTWTGSTLRSRPVAEKAEIARALRARVWPLLNSGEIKPLIHKTFPLTHAAEAHRLMESSDHIGKIILTI